MKQSDSRSDESEQPAGCKVAAGPARLPVPESPHFTCLRGEASGLVQGGPPPESEAFSQILELSVGRPLLGGNRIRELINGEEFFPAMLELVRGARCSVTLEIYIWRSGQISEQFIQALSERTRAGVKVHVIGDGVGLAKMKRKDMDRLKAAGIHFVFFERPRAGKIKANINHRTHRKILVVDGRIGITGGICIADEWQGNATEKSHWRDNGYLVQGPMVHQMQAVFAENWLDTTGQLLWGDEYFPALCEEGETRGHFYRTQPTGRYTSIRRTFFLAIACARHHIRIAHAYFVPDDEATTLLIEARKRNVRVEIVIPMISDTILGRAVTRSRLQPLLEHGIEIYRFCPAMYHCKYFIVDDIFVSAGSSNFDPRSFHMNDEADFNVIDCDFSSRQVTLFEKDKKQSKPYSLIDHNNRPLYQKIFDWVFGWFWRAF